MREFWAIVISLISAAVFFFVCAAMGKVTSELAPMNLSPEFWANYKIVCVTAGGASAFLFLLIIAAAFRREETPKSLRRRADILEQRITVKRDRSQRESIPRSDAPSLPRQL